MSSSTPLIFKRSGKAKPQRARQPTPEVDDNVNESETTESREDSPSTVAAKLKNKVKKARTKSRLSFGAEEEEGEGEVFQIKKSKLSKSLTLGKLASNVPLNLEQASISPSRPTYDQAYLNELKATTPTSRPPQYASADADMSMDVEVSTRSVDVFEDADASGEAFIPSESSVKAVKEKRERLRKLKVSGEEDFISLSVTRRSEDSGPHPESRLVREEDELGEGEDEFAEYTSAQDRIALGKKSRKKEASKRREAMEEMINDAEEVDEETMEWEQEQLRRGGHRTYEPSTSSKPKQTYKPAPIPAQTTIPTLQPAISRLTQQLAQLTASHATNSAALQTLAQEREEVEKREIEMRDLVIKAEAKRAWFGEFRDWLESVAGFLDEKYPLLEKLEEEQLYLLNERLEMVTTRRRTDDEDDLSAFYGPLPAPEPSEMETEETDDLGRIVPKPSSAVLRKERRAARNVRHERRVQKRSRTQADEEGYSTDSSLPPTDASDYSSAVSSLATRLKEVLSDVKAEEFRHPTGVKWSAWREKYGDSYRNAWGGLGVVSAWEFWVRLEIAGWDCIEDARSLDSFKWYKGLYEYSRPATDENVNDEEERELGPDGDLVASMISTALIPRVCKVIEGGALDVYSESHIRRMVDLAEEIEATMEEGSNKFQTLLAAVLSRFRIAVEDTENLLSKFDAISKQPAPFNPEAIPSRRRFLLRRLKLLKNLWRWRKYTGERFGVDKLLTRLIENCFIVVAQSGWEVGGRDAARTVASILPRELLPIQMKQLMDM
ncbi:nineteen complex-related protein 2-domain-containing protein [Ephemerocybe angulata]|uniref:Nineteen complex-related protein 2-domain-containing protein n=1 Tax=Ephemerocybe angulata TaxID=980116 RepID=A0A8H6HZA4_9AGAR|nr:nineteen complex-related protein 2-domain-containing protein [Tulosesus angulatus]